jgi:hypothetical protein
MNRLTTDQVLATPASELAERPSEWLFQLKSDAADQLTNAKALIEHVDQVLDIKWSDRARNLRRDLGKDTGVVHFDEGRVCVTSELNKKVDWDQGRLAEIARRIAEGGEDPRQYIEITYRVSETKFNAWPETIKSAFAAARTVRPGKSSYRLALMKE